MKMIPEEIIEEPLSLSLAPYTGVWTKEEAGHLLRRTLIGPTFPQLQQAIADGLETTVNNLLQLTPTDPPLAYHPDEAVVPIGTTWVNAPYPSGFTVDTANTRRASLMSYSMQRINKIAFSIQEKMCLFFTNHFGVNLATEARAMYQLHEIYRTYCLGDFKQMIKEVTINPAMLDFLNGNTNNIYSPNENFSRELLELFTVGRGPQIGPGDYSTYTEADVQAGAKILTGWSNWDVFSDVYPTAISTFNPGLHDSSTKILSSYFGNAVVNNADENEYANYIDLIFQLPSMGRHICRKLYRWFVNYDITPTIESTIITEMTTTFQNNNWNLYPVMEQLLKSEHFFDVSLRGTIIKNPIEFFFSFMKPSFTTPNYTIGTNYHIFLHAYWRCGGLGMYVFAPPSVGGWTAYYQVPSFSKTWANSYLMKGRFDTSDWLIMQWGIDSGGNTWRIDSFALIASLSNPSNAEDVISDLEALFSPKPLSSATRLMLKSILTNGLPDFEWTVQYNDYLANPGDLFYSEAVRNRVESLLKRFTQLPQFHIM